MKDLNYYLSLPYKVGIEYEPIDNSWIAFCPELGSGACYAIGDTKEEALKLLEDEKADLLELLLELKKTIPEPKTEEEELPSGQFIVRIPKTLHKKVQERSAKEGVSLNHYVSTVLAESVGERNVLYNAKKIISKNKKENH